MTWVEKYRPKLSEDIAGQDSIIEHVRDFLKNFSAQNKKAILLCGPPGCGKTSMAYAVSSEFNMEVFEVNASDTRNKASIEEIVGGASRQMSLFMNSKVILLDEIDGLSGSKDRGGAGAISKIIKSSAFPIILIANDAYSDKLKDIRKVSKILEFNVINYISIRNIFEKILKDNNIEYDIEALNDLARRSGGDLRSGINDLESLSIIHKKITSDVISSVDSRDKKDNIQNALFKVFKTKDIQTSKNSFDNIPENYDTVFMWLDYNISKEYKDIDDIYHAYDSLSKANVFAKRITRRQDWRYLVYVYFYMTVGISLAKKEKYKGFTKYQPTSRILKMWQANMSSAKRKAFCKRMQEFFHANFKELNYDLFPFMKVFIKNEDTKKAMIQEFELTEEEITLLEK